MLKAFLNSFRIPDLRNKILFTLFIITLYRFGSHIPVPVVDTRVLQNQASSGGFLDFINLFSGGGLNRFSVFSLGIMPYITSSIIMQLLTVVIPKLQQWQDQGEAGVKRINQATRYVTVVLALLQSTGLVFLFHSGQNNIPDLFPSGTFKPPNVLLIVLTMTAGTALIMWLGELITQRGVGNETMGGSTYLPLKVNQAGVIPIIFATSVLYFPVLIASVYHGQWFSDFVNKYVQNQRSILYMFILASLIVFFSYFYTAIQFDPVRTADNLRQQGGSVPVRRHVDPDRRGCRARNDETDRVAADDAALRGFPAVAGGAPDALRVPWTPRCRQGDTGSDPFGAPGHPPDLDRRHPPRTRARRDPPRHHGEDLHGPG